MFRRKRHSHEWDATGVNVNQIYDGWARSEHPVRIETVVLRVCVSCGARDVQTLRGRWTLEQVRGLMAPPREHVDA